MQNKLQLIAHRGDTVHFPENTLPAFQSAFDKGAGGIEMDVQLVNGKIIVVHNYLFDTTREYPLLEDVLKTCKERGKLEIEVKAFSTDIISPLHQLISQYQPKQFEITTSELPLIPYLVEVFGTTNCGVIFNECHYHPWMNEEIILRKTKELMTLMKASVAHLGHLPQDKLTPSFVDSLHEAGFKIHHHIKKIEMEKQIHLYTHLNEVGVDQCTFDDIGLLEDI